MSLTLALPQPAVPAAPAAAMSPTLGFGTCCLKGAASEEQALLSFATNPRL